MVGMGQAECESYTHARPAAGAARTQSSGAPPRRGLNAAFAVVWALLICALLIGGARAACPCLAGQYCSGGTTCVTCACAAGYYCPVSGAVAAGAICPQVRLSILSKGCTSALFVWSPACCGSCARNILALFFVCGPMCSQPRCVQSRVVGAGLLLPWRRGGGAAVPERRVDVRGRGGL